MFSGHDPQVDLSLVSLATNWTWIEYDLRSSFASAPAAVVRRDLDIASLSGLLYGSIFRHQLSTVNYCKIFWVALAMIVLFSVTVSSVFKCSTFAYLHWNSTTVGWSLSKHNYSEHSMDIYMTFTCLQQNSLPTQHDHWVALKYSVYTDFNLKPARDRLRICKIVHGTSHFWVWYILYCWTWGVCNSPRVDLTVTCALDTYSSIPAW